MELAVKKYELNATIIKHYLVAIHNQGFDEMSDYFDADELLSLVVGFSKNKDVDFVANMVRAWAEVCAPDLLTD